MTPSGKEPDCYQVLEVPETASNAQIRGAYRDLVAKFHPDHYENHPLQELARQRLQQVNAAYAVLGDARRRAVYDASRRAAPFAGQPFGGGSAMPAGLPAAWMRRFSRAVAVGLLLMVLVRSGGLVLRGVVGAFGILRATPLGLVVAALGVLAGGWWWWKRRRRV